MAFSRSVFTVLLLCVACKASVPVFLWGDLISPTLKANPLTTTTAPGFSKILAEERANNQYTVVFIENELSNDDLARKSNGETAYPYLHANLPKSIYLPSVQNPVEAIYHVDAAVNDERVSLDLGDSFNLQEIISNEGEGATPDFLFINLNDAKEGETRTDLLRRHNDFMEVTVAKLKKEFENVVAVYTGRKSLHRVRRQAAEQAQSSGDLLLDGVRLYAKNIRLTEGTNTVLLQGLSGSTSEINSTALTTKTTLNFADRSIILNFRGTGGYWFFDSVTVNPGADALELAPDSDVYALDGFAYRCAANVSFSNGNSNSTSGYTILRFEDLKVQVQFESTNQSSPLVFGDSYHCVGFFSAPIWASLFVVFILLAITFYGIIMMMDIKTMDRFDDPKGKTININASD